jgi:hypothetical protein
MTTTTFEDRLLAELRAVVAERPAPEPEATAPGPRRRAPGTRLALAGSAVAATAAGAFLVAGGDTSTPAYAVAKQSDGSVTVEVHSLRDAAGLQEKLRAAGIPAVVDYTPFGKMCREPRGRPAATGHQMGSMGVGEGSHVATFTIPRGEVRPGQTLVITSSVGSSVSSLGSEIVEGPVAPCELVDAPALPAPGSGGGADAGQGLSTGGANAGSTSAGPSTHTGP